MANYNVYMALNPFCQHDRISSHQLTNYWKNCALSITPQMLVEDGWLDVHQCEDTGIWTGDVYYVLTDKAIHELSH